MRKIGIFVLTMSLLLSLAGCHVKKSYKEMEAKQQVADMLEAMTHQDMEAVLALMHPDLLEDEMEKLPVIDRLQQIMDYMDGRKVLYFEQISLNVNKSKGTSGTVTQEQAVFKIGFAEEGLYVSATYLTENGKSGFTSYQLILGVL